MPTPRMDGLEATGRIRAGGASARAPVVALTVNAFQEDRQRCLAAGMDAHLTKPVDMQAFYATLLQQLDGRPATR